LSIVQIATEFDKLTDTEIDDLPELLLVIARCAPDTKIRIIEALRRRDAFTAMTGDSVNDAPSLSYANVGIAMGSGSDVAKSAAKIVLTDDKFNSIVAAIREGRRMFDNVQKFVLHLLSSNVGEVILLVAGLGFRDEAGFSGTNYTSSGACRSEKSTEDQWYEICEILFRDKERPASVFPASTLHPHPPNKSCPENLS
jgi:magnesium-transporting ATPase (P-type)